MSSGHIVAIQVKPYLKEFIINRYGQEPIKATSSTKLFPLFAPFLTHKPVGWKPPEPSENRLLFELPHNKVIDVRSLNYINPRHFPEINSFFYGLFYGQFIRYMNDKVIKLRWQAKYAIINFVDENNISWNKANYETLKKIYYRYRFPDERNEEKDEKKFPTFQTKPARKRPLSVPNNLF